MVFTSRRGVHIVLLAAVTTLGLMAGRAFADVCVTIDETRDMFSPNDRAAALLLLQRQFELAGEHVVPAGCPAAYVVSHIQLGSVVDITLSGPNGQREATALGMEDVLAVYSQMVRSLLLGVPMTAAGVVNRTNVSETQASKRRIYSDSVTYARLGYTAMFADQTFGGPTIGVFGYRKELDAFALDISFGNVVHQSSTGSSYYGTRSGGTTTSWLKLEALRFMTPISSRSVYAGGGLSWSKMDLEHEYTSWSGDGLQGEITAGYELERASTLRVFLQADAGLPFYRLHSDTYIYSNTYPYTTVATSSRRYVPSFGLSLGLGWQHGGK